MRITKYIDKIKKSNDNTTLFNNITGSFVIRGFSLLLSFFLMPAYIKYFDEQIVLGLWFTVVSLLNWILVFDLGIGNGLRNNLIVSIANNDDKTSRKLISSTYIIVGIISLILIIVGIGVIPLFNWNRIFKIDSELISPMILLYSVLILYIGTILHFFFKIITSILHTLQKNLYTSIIAFSSTLIVFIYVNLIRFDSLDMNLLMLSIVNALSILLPLLVASLITFTRKMRMLIPKLKYFEYKTAKKILILGGRFFWIQIALLFINSTNQIIITRWFGPGFVVEYQIYYRLFYLIVSIFSLVSNPIWSSISKANSEGNYVWIKKIKSKLFLASSVFVFGSFLLTFILQFVIDIWLGKDYLETNLFVSLIFAINSSVLIYLLAVTSIANGLNRLKSQLIWTSFAAISKVPISFALYLLMDKWIVVVIANIIILLPSLIANTVCINSYLDRKIESIGN